MSKSAKMNYHDFFLTKTRIKDHIHKNGLECSNNTFHALNSKILDILDDGIERAKKNARKRLLARDV